MNSSDYIPLTKVLAKIIDNRGKSVPTVAEGFPLIATNCIKESSIYPTFEDIRYVDDFTLKNWFRAHLAPNDILFINKGTPGRVCLVPDPVTFCAAQDMIGLRADRSKINYKFLFAVLRSNWVKQKIHNYHVGLVIPHFKKQDLDSILIPRRTTEEQEFIGNLYISLSEKIELNNKINQELEAIAKTLYEYWFVQFDFPNEQGKPYKSSGGKMVYNEKLKRLIPEWWKLGTIKDIADLYRGVSYSDKDIKCMNDNDTTPILRATNIEGNIIDLNDMVFVPNALIKLNQFVNKYDIIITMSSGSKRHIGKNGFYYFNEKVGFGAFCAKLVAKNNFRFYLYSYTQSDFMFATIKNECLGTNINNLNSSLVNGFKVILPPSGLIDSFNTKVESFYKKIENNYIQNKKLVELRDWLLPMLMNGQVSVGEAEEKLNIAAEPSVNYNN